MTTIKITGDSELKFRVLNFTITTIKNKINWKESFDTSVKARRDINIQGPLDLFLELEGDKISVVVYPDITKGTDFELFRQEFKIPTGKLLEERSFTLPDVDKFGLKLKNLKVTITPSLNK